MLAATKRTEVIRRIRRAGHRLQKMRDASLAGEPSNVYFSAQWDIRENRMTISDEPTLRLRSGSDLFVPHIGWLRYPSSDIVLLHLREGSFEFREQAFLL